LLSDFAANFFLLAKGQHHDEYNNEKRSTVPDTFPGEECEVCTTVQAAQIAAVAQSHRHKISMVLPYNGGKERPESYVDATVRKYIMPNLWTFDTCSE
jgi:hypothetical protein